MNECQVDRIEGEWVVLVDGEQEILLPLSWFEGSVAEGTRVVVRLDMGGNPLLSDEIEGRLERLVDRCDEGKGNISL